MIAMLKRPPRRRLDARRDGRTEHPQDAPWQPEGAPSRPHRLGRRERNALQRQSGCLGSRVPLVKSTIWKPRHAKHSNIRYGTPCAGSDRASAARSWTFSPVVGQRKRTGFSIASWYKHVLPPAIDAHQMPHSFIERRVRPLIHYCQYSHGRWATVPDPVDAVL